LHHMPHKIGLYSDFGSDGSETVIFPFYSTFSPFSPNLLTNLTKRARAREKAEKG
jgi:hypothetical protein